MSRFVPHRLDRVHQALARHVESGLLPGAVTALSSGDEVHIDAVGDVRRDSIFRISSMTKPIAAVGAMVLVEECVLRLDDPLTDWLPELAGPRVLRDPAGPLDDTVPAQREITLRDLLTFRNGFGMLPWSPEPYPIQEAAAELNPFGPPKPFSPFTADEWLKKLGEFPLMHQPGTRWLYHTGAEILGALLARASGQDLETFLTERVFTPLGMTDTAFSVPAGKLDRFTTSYWPNEQTGELEVYDEVGGSWSKPPVFPSAGGGLVSTVDDLLAFSRLFRTTEVLSRASITTMTADHLTPQQKAESGFFPGYFDNRGWGFGVAVSTRRDSIYETPGRFGWDGGLGTSWAVDPTEDLVGVLLTQRADFPLMSKAYQDFWTSAYQALA
ncbi:serine hydrolase domain-containing protein [Amycolatopsis albispora]|uniref:Serine hydrolase n=1 Tax=Amycolatopsis albispora TaxID=1804986 RepID=A0A344LHG7_9PSEU|nr:serine hydrolase domain-containing protein [Amycolatopsis albispora]AXB47491.1 serine hydrolase [Amycolatopsis albispora]